MVRRLYLVVVLQDWDTLKPEDQRLQPEIRVKPWPGCVGYSPIFDSREAAEREFPDATILPLDVRERP